MPIASFGYNPQVLTVDDTEIEFNNTSLFADEDEWDFGDNTPISNVENPLHFYPFKSMKWLFR